MFIKDKIINQKMKIDYYIRFIVSNILLMTAWDDDGAHGKYWSSVFNYSFSIYALLSGSSQLYFIPRFLLFYISANLLVNTFFILLTKKHDCAVRPMHVNLKNMWLWGHTSVRYMVIHDERARPHMYKAKKEISHNSYAKV